jgi:acetyl esterase
LWRFPELGAAGRPSGAAALALRLPVRPEHPEEGVNRPGDRPPIVLDAGHRAFLAALASAGIAGQTSLDDLRAAAAAVRLPFQAGGAPMQALCEAAIATAAGEASVRFYYPVAERPLRALLYFHGGGWTMLSLATHDRIMREFAAWTGRAVVGVELPQAPEVPFPGALDLARATVVALAGEAGRHGLDGQMALAGDSSGANLALSAAIALRDEGRRLVDALILAYGVFDCDFSRPSYRAFSRPPLTLSADRMAWFWSNYCPSDGARADPLAAPLHADLRGLPPAHLVVAGQDVLRDENLAMAVRLAEAGNAVSLDHYPEAPHGFLEALALAPLGARAIARAAAWLNDRARDPPPGDHEP